MVSNTLILAFVIAILFTLVLPFVLVIVLGARRKISIIPMLVGAAAFFISQIILRVPLLSLLGTQEWYVAFAQQNMIVALLLVCLSAGLFEESARLGGALILKNNRSFKDIISFGLGHAFCEVILLVGFTHVNNLLLCLAINDAGGTLAAAMTALSPEAFEEVAAQLVASNPGHVFWGILERVSAVAFHVFATVLVFKGVIEKKLWYYLLAILAHTAFNFIGVMAAEHFGIVVSEVVLLAMALACGYYIWRVKREMAE